MRCSRLRLAWLNWAERGMVVFLVLVFLSANTINVVTTIDKLVRAQIEPATTLTRLDLSTRPSDAALVLCSPVPGDIVEELVCGRLLFDELEDGTVQFSDATNLCNTSFVTVQGGFRCVVLYDVLGFPSNVFSNRVWGRTGNCIRNPQTCNIDNVYGAAVPAANVQTVFSAPNFERIPTLPLPNNNLAHIRASVKIIRDLDGNENREYSMSAFSTRPLVTAVPEESFHNVSFVIDIDTFSWDLAAEVTSEIVVFDIYDAMSAVAAIFSLTTGIFFFLFPTSARLPIHFRYGRYGRVRNVSHVVEERNADLFMNTKQTSVILPGSGSHGGSGASSHISDGGSSDGSDYVIELESPV